MKLSRSVSLVILSAAIAGAQTTLDYKTQGRNADFSSFSVTKPAQVGTTLPVSCALGQVFFKLDAAPGSNLYGCAQNTWWPQGGSVRSIFGRTGDILPANGDYQFGMISGVASLSQGGTGATTAAAALLNLGAASLLHTHSVDQVGNAVSTLGAYPDPGWLTSLSWTKLSGVPGVFAPSAHAATHRHGGDDEVGSLAPTAYGIPKAGAAGKLSPTWLDLSGYQSNLGFDPLDRAGNLGDLSNVVSARLNLGLGTAALKNVQGAGVAIPTVSGILPVYAIPSVDSTGTQVDSGCLASAGVLTCNSGAATRIGITKGAAPSDAVIGGAPFDAVLYLDSADMALKLRGAGGVVVPLGGSTIHFTIDGGGSVITAGTYPVGQLSAPCAINGWSLVADQPGSVAIELAAHSSSPPPSPPSIPNAAADKITASAPMSLSAAQSASGAASSVSTWNTARAAWDSFAINITGTPSSVTRITGAVYCQ